MTLYVLPCLSTTSSFQCASFLSSQPSLSGSPRSWAHLLQAVFPDHSVKIALQSPVLYSLSSFQDTGISISLGSSLFFFDALFIIWNYIVYSFLSLFVISLPQRNVSSLREGAFSPETEPDTCQSEITKPNVLCFNTLSPTSSSSDLSQVSLIATKANILDFPGGLVVKTLHSQCRDPGFDPWSGK